MKLKNSIIKATGLSLLLCTLSCKKFVAIAPSVDQIETAKVYADNETATAAIQGVYAKMISGRFASGNAYSVTLMAGRSADDFINQSATENLKQFSVNNLLPENNLLRLGLWQEPYQLIYAANAVLENLQKSEKVSSGVKQQLQGEAKFIRAFCHFYLTNLFGDIPLILTTDYRLNAVAFASSPEQVYQQVIKDLIDAKILLAGNYPTTDRIRVNKWAATALLARVYLYHEEWENAEIQSAEVIAQDQLYRIDIDIDQAFLKNSKEAIFQLIAPASFPLNTLEGNVFILDAAPGSLTDITLSADLVTAFETGDQRLTKWVGTFTSGGNSWHYPYKYKIKSGNSPLNEYSMVLRLAEQYLIRAEARINSNKIDLGVEDLNVIRKRARALPTIAVPNPLPPIPLGIDKAGALLAVEQERRIELFSEWGHRWLDLKRTNRAITVLGPKKITNWQNTDVLYPIPASELLNAPNLNQNIGYQENHKLK